jgi:hypothetical protein
VDQQWNLLLAVRLAIVVGFQNVDGGVGVEMVEKIVEVKYTIQLTEAEMKAVLSSVVDYKTHPTKGEDKAILNYLAEELSSLLQEQNKNA